MSYQPLTVGDALNRGWAAFQSRIKEFLIVGIGFGLIIGIIAAVVTLVLVGSADDTTFEVDPVTGDVTSASGGFFAGFIGSMILLWLVMIVGGIFVVLFNTRIALAAADGETQYSMGDLMKQAMSKFWPFTGWYLLASLIVGALFCTIIGWIAALFFFIFVPFVVLDRDRLPDTNPLSGSFNAVKDQAGNLILVFLVLAGIYVGLIIINIVLGIIPFVGQVIAFVLGVMFTGFALSTLAVVYRASPLGGAVGGGGVAGSAIPPYQGGMPQQGYPPQAPPQQGYQQAPPQPGGYAPQPPPAAPPQTGGYPQQAPQPQAPPPQPPPQAPPPQAPPQTGGYPQQAPQPQAPPPQPPPQQPPPQQAPPPQAPPQQQVPPAPPPGHQPPPPPQAPPPPPPQ